MNAGRMLRAGDVGNNGVMRTRQLVVVTLAFFALIASACGSSTTVQGRDSDSAASSAEQQPTGDTTTAELDLEPDAPEPTSVPEAEAEDVSPADDEPVHAPEDEPADAASDDEPDTAIEDEPSDVTDEEAEVEEELAALLDFDREEQLQSLANDCRDDSNQACDILFLISDGGSEFEDIGLNCGERGLPESGWCTTGITSTALNLEFDLDSPALPEIRESCADGDMTACDFLYFGSPSGSDEETFGNGCGGRVEVAFPDCRTELG